MRWSREPWAAPWKLAAALLWPWRATNAWPLRGALHPLLRAPSCANHFSCAAARRAAPGALLSPAPLLLPAPHPFPPLPCTWQRPPLWRQLPDRGLRLSKDLSHARQAVRGHEWPAHGRADNVRLGLGAIGGGGGLPLPPGCLPHKGVGLRPLPCVFRAAHPSPPQAPPRHAPPPTPLLPAVAHKSWSSA